MSRRALVLGVLLLAGCEAHVTSERVAFAIEACAPHGGLSHLSAPTLGPAFVRATCRDRVKITATKVPQ